jgi:hypothetical protein
MTSEVGVPFSTLSKLPAKLSGRVTLGFFPDEYFQEAPPPINI